MSHVMRSRDEVSDQGYMMRTRDKVTPGMHAMKVLVGALEQIGETHGAVA